MENRTLCSPLAHNFQDLRELQPVDAQPPRLKRRGPSFFIREAMIRPMARYWEIIVAQATLPTPSAYRYEMRFSTTFTAPLTTKKYIGLLLSPQPGG